ncbi:MAG: hypothetical protein PVG07_15955, partial [Acidobacteriota bacterium]
EPFEIVRIPRPGRRGQLAGTWFPATGEARGAVLLLPPWLQWGRSYFHRRGRIPALRERGYHALTLDFPGFDGSGPVSGFFDRDVADGLRYLADRAPGLPRHVWGVSAGGYWSHLALTWSDERFDPEGALGGGGVHGAVFEDVSPHLIEWGGRMMPAARPLHLVFRTAFFRSDRYLDLRRHAPELRARRVAYASGELDPGVPPEDTRELAGLAGGTVRVVPGAGHLEAIKLARDEILALALDTFEASVGSP